MLRFVFVALLLGSLFPVVSAQSPQKDATSTVTGTVTLNGSAVRNAVVSLQAQYQSVPQAPLRTKTDADGRFRFAEVAAGQYMISALTPGFYSASDFQYGFPGRTLNVGKGETIENIELQLKRGAVITGRVTDENDEPIAETQVQLQRVGDRVSLRQNMLSLDMYRTDDRGVYRIYGLPPGKYQVSVGSSARDGLISYQNLRASIEQTFHPDTTDQAKAKVVELEEGQIATDVDIRIGKRKNSYEVSGRVVDGQTGQPVVGVSLELRFIQPSTERVSGWTLSSGLRTDANGEFQLLGLHPGKYIVSIRAAAGKDEYFNDPITIEVANSDLAGIEIRAQRGAVISGWAVIEGTTDPTILAKRPQINLNAATEDSTFAFNQRSARVRTDGSFQIGGLSAGKKRLIAYTGATGLSLVRIEQNGAPIKDNQIEVRAGEEIKNVRFVFAHSTAAIRGRLEFVGGALPEGISIMVMAQPSERGSTNGKSAQLDARGQFVLEGLLPGEYNLRLSASYPQLSTQEISLLTRKIMNHTQRVSVAKDSQIQLTITIDLSQEGR
ncbi:MAG: carboxypeptidase-like regulatory domain-containing protein [Acidobacteriota bacterium]|nr:carboxypeptidase-like regulatory domain-containing protein [Acidobacteriota bacterium]